MRDICKAFCGVAVAGLIVWLGLVATGCRLSQGAADSSGNAAGVATLGKSQAPVKAPAELQQQLLRFIDQYLARALAAVEELESADRKWPATPTSL